MADAEKPETTVDELLARVGTFWTQEMRSVNHKLTKLTKKKAVAKLVLFLKMLAEPGWWSVATLKRELLARSGVLKYSYSGSVNCSMCSPLTPLVKSKTVIVTIADDGSTTGWSI